MDRPSWVLWLAAAALMFAATLVGGSSVSGTAEAHGGGLNRCGCHFNRRTGECHCHRDRGCGCECQSPSCPDAAL